MLMDFLEEFNWNGNFMKSALGVSHLLSHEKRNNIVPLNEWVNSSGNGPAHLVLLDIGPSISTEFVCCNVAIAKYP